MMWEVFRMRVAPEVCYRFGGFHLDVRDRRLARDEEVIRLEPKSFDVLCCLLENAGRLVSKQDLVAKVWSRTYVSDNSLTRCIHQVRAALGDDADRPDFIETVPGSGYRFIADVDVSTGSGPDDELQAAEKPRSMRLAGIAIVLAIAVGTALVPSWLNDRGEVPTIERLAVLPFTNLTGAVDQEYFVQGVHEALIAELSRIASIDVISRTSVMSFRDTRLSVPEIAARLDVDAVIEGSVAKAGDKLTVTAQLIATNPERHLWAERYHRDVGELFEIATDIVSAIASEIAIELSPVERRASINTENREAWEAYLQGRFYFEQRTPDAYRLARDKFQHAIELDPDFAEPYVGLAHTFGSAAIFGIVKPEAGFPQALRFAQQAISLDPSLAEAHLLLAGVSFYWDWDWDEAERQARHVLELNPSLANAYRFLSEVYSVKGRHEEALNAVERGREIDPLPPTSQFKPAFILYLARDYEEAIARAESALPFYPAFWQGHWLLCLSFAATDRYSEAVAACRNATEASGNLPVTLGTLGYALALAGQDEEALEIAESLEALGSERYVGPTSIAIIYGAIGMTDKAFEHLERAYTVRDQQLVHAEHAAYLDPLRTDGRFLNLQRASASGSTGDKEKISKR
jgi:TolB-like protein/DNA-binding winged helix-turn-helix (wHTH) protein/cytochrome c-type biogenesis protein CcmH/NrfG